MALALHKPTKTLHSGIGPADLVPAEDWIVDPVIPVGAELPYVVIEGDTIRAMTDEERAAVHPETMAERHLREQNQGVEIAASGVGFVKYTEEVRKLWQDLELFLRRCGGGVPGVTVWNAAGQQFNLSVADANAVIDEYTFKTGLQRMRQIAEVG